MGTKNNPGKFDCYENAAPDEPMFILLGRDPSASHLVRIWAEMRKLEGEDPDKLAEALSCADAMQDWAEGLGKQEHVDRYAMSIIGILKGVEKVVSHCVNTADNPPTCTSFKLPGCVISSDCPKCNKQIIMDFNKDHRYLSYPIPGEIDDLSFWCEDCDEEWEVSYRFHLAVRIEAVVTE